MKNASISRDAAAADHAKDRASRRWLRWVMALVLGSVASLPLGVAAWQGDGLAVMLHMEGMVLPEGGVPSLLPEVAQALPFL